MAALVIKLKNMVTVVLLTVTTCQVTQLNIDMFHFTSQNFGFQVDLPSVRVTMYTYSHKTHFSCQKPPSKYISVKIMACPTANKTKQKPLRKFILFINAKLIPHI